MEVKGSELERKRVLGNLRVVKFDASRSMEAATRTMMKICVRIRIRCDRLRGYFAPHVGSVESGVGIDGLLGRSFGRSGV